MQGLGQPIEYVFGGKGLIGQSKLQFPQVMLPEVFFDVPREGLECVSNRGRIRKE